MEHGIPLTYEDHGIYGNVCMIQSKLISYMEWILDFNRRKTEIKEQEKDIWEIEKLNINIQENLIKKFKTINFTKVLQINIRNELKKGIYLNLQCESISCVMREMTAMRRLSKYLSDKQKLVFSCQDISREILEEYLIYLKTENTSTKHYRSELNRL